MFRPFLRMCSPDLRARLTASKADIGSTGALHHHGLSIGIQQIAHRTLQAGCVIDRRARHSCRLQFPGSWNKDDWVLGLHCGNILAGMRPI